MQHPPTAASLATRARDIVLFTLATFVGACLLFLIQPMVGRALLPRLGGAPFVWVVCLAFFQLGLFLGYLWVHLSATRLSLRAQLIAQLILVVAALVLTPLHLSGPVLPVDGPPALGLLGFLVLTVGLPYIALATTTPLLQLAYARRSGQRPYHLYAVSNAGSLVGLLAYPFLLEPQLELEAQASAWTVGLGIYAALLLAIGVSGWRSRSKRHNGTSNSTTAGAARAGTNATTTAGRRRAWFWLAAAPAALLSAISNHVTVDVAASPLLWVLVLALYLLSFMIAFANPRWHFAEPYRALWIACSVAMPVMLLPGNQVPLPLMLGVPAVTLWAGAMLCHGELARRSPEAGQLTSFYIWLSAGGAAGGGFVAFLAPVLFDGHYELPIAMLATHGVLAAVSARRDPREAPTGAQRLTWLGTGLAVPVLLGTLYAQVTGLGQPGTTLERSRSFFGPLEVTRTSASTILTHGRTHHGKQLRDPALRSTPVAYFGPESGVGRTLRLHHAGSPRAIGVLGLGVGTVAAYTKRDDRMVFYEIDPDVTRLARAHFSYLDDAAGHVRIIHGDGRMQLEREPRVRYDILLLDAFSSDSVPTHLLTVEAFAVYLRSLSPGGVLAANVSNRHLAIERVVAGSAGSHGLHHVTIESPGDRARGLSRARWTLMARDAGTLAPLLAEPVERLRIDHPVVWSDRFSSLWTIAGGSAAHEP